MNETPHERLRRLANAIGQTPVEPIVLAASMSTEELCLIARDPSRDSATRIQAVAALLEQAKTEEIAANVVMSLLDDANEQVALFAVSRSQAFDQRQRERLARMLDDPRPAFWQAAAEALARRKERALLPLFLNWLRQDDGAHRLAGLRALCWILNPHERMHFLESACASGWPRDDHERLQLAEQLGALRSAQALELIDTITPQSDETALQIRALRARVASAMLET